MIMARVATVVRSRRWGLLLALAVGAVRLAAQPAVLVPTTMGVQQPYVLGLLSPPVMTVTSISGNTVKSTSTATIRSNAGWQLQVTLAPPVSSNLTVKVVVGKGKAITLTATAPSAVVSTGTAACLACAVTMDWDFTYKVSGRNAPRPAVAPITYTVLPPAGVALLATPAGVGAAPSLAADSTGTTKKP
jgi:hypothetical protein